MSTEHWMYGPGGIDNAQGGSWYQYIFELLDPTIPRMRFQTGTGGTWYVINLQYYRNVMIISI